MSQEKILLGVLKKEPIIKSWNTKYGIVTVYFYNGKPYVKINDGKEALIPTHLVSGFPKDMISDQELLINFLEKTHIRINKSSNDQYYLRIIPSMLGGGNTINPISESNRLWAHAEVPYEIDTKKYPVGENERKIILSAIRKWNDSNTGFTLAHRTSTEQKDFLVFGEADGICYSNVGRQGGRQYIRCDLDGGRFNEGSIMHEIGHVVGLYHEHKRPDRNSYVTVSQNKIDEKPADYKKEGAKNGKYDFFSIMHYPMKVNELSLKPRSRIDPNEVGQRQDLSDGDKAATNYLAKHAKKIVHETSVKSASGSSSSSAQFFQEYRPLYVTWKQQATKALNKTDYREAVRHYLNLYNEYHDDVDPKEVSLWFFRYGFCKESLNEMKQAKIGYQQALRYDEQNNSARQRLQEISQPNFCLIL